MRIFCKYVVRTMLEKKARLVLLLFAIALSTALFFASLGLTDLIMDSVSRPVVERTEGHQIRIVPTSGESFFDLEDVVFAGIDSHTASIALPGVIQNMDHETVTLHGRTWDSLSSYTFKDPLEEDAFTGSATVISARVAMALVAVGGQFRAKRSRDLMKPLIAGVIGRLFVVPVFAFSLAALLSNVIRFDGAWAGLVSIFASPVAVASVAVTKGLEGDDEFAGQLVIWSTAMAVFTLFFLIVIFRQLGLL